MKFVIVLAAVACVANAGLIAAPAVVSRAPAFDSAVIKSDRIGGNFAYSTAENHAYAVSTPIVQNVATPVAVSYSAPAVSYAAPAVSYAAPAISTYAAAPAFAHQAYAHAAPLAYSGLYGHGFYGAHTLALK